MSGLAMLSRLASWLLQDGLERHTTFLSPLCPVPASESGVLFGPSSTELLWHVSGMAYKLGSEESASDS